MNSDTYGPEQSPPPTEEEQQVSPEAPPPWPTAPPIPENPPRENPRPGEPTVDDPDQRQVPIANTGEGQPDVTADEVPRTRGGIAQQQNQRYVGQVDPGEGTGWDEGGRFDEEPSATPEGEERDDTGTSSSR